MEKEYRCEATTIEGFVQQLAVSLVANGYWFYMTGTVPERKDPRAVDRKLIRKYHIDCSKFARYRRKAGGGANVQYLRCGRFYVLLATKGKHLFFEEEHFKDCRETPVKFAGYAISYRGGHAHVRIERETYRELKAYFEDLAVHRSRETLEKAFRSLPFEPYAPVRGQLFAILRAVNRRRKVASYEPINWSCLRLRRRIWRPFEDVAEGEPAKPAGQIFASRQSR
jgi:hypothetical protein